MHHWILRFAKFGEMVTWNTSLPKTPFSTYNWPAAQLEVLAMASNLPR
jgi:hypothetical protein